MASMQAVAESFRVLNITHPQHYKHLGEKDVLQLLKISEYSFHRYSHDALKKAVMDAIRSCKYFPSVAEIIDHCRAYEDGYKDFAEIMREQEADEPKPDGWGAYAGENPSP